MNLMPNQRTVNKTITAIISAVIAGVLWATPASAHTPNVVASCVNLTVTLTQYEGSSPNNRVTTTIDGAVTVADFGGSYSQTFGWSETASHVWSVVIDANRISGNPTQWDRTFSGTEQACQTATTTTTEPPATTTIPSTTTTIPAATTVPDVSTTSPATTVPAPTAPTTVPTPATTIVPNDGPTQLPNTGSDWLIGLGFAAAALVIIGACLRRGTRCDERRP